LSLNPWKGGDSNGKEESRQEEAGQEKEEVTPFVATPVATETKNPRWSFHRGFFVPIVKIARE